MQYFIVLFVCIIIALGMKVAEYKRPANMEYTEIWQKGQKLSQRLDHLEKMHLKIGCENTKEESAPDVVLGGGHQKISVVKLVTIKGKEVLMLNVEQFREFVVRPTLQDLDMWSEAAEDLMVGTAVQESKLVYLTQHGGGPAKGVYQIELATAMDVVVRYLGRGDKVDLAIKFYDAADTISTDIGNASMEDRLITNLKYATAVARIKYYMVAEAMPEAGDIEAYAKYWKKYYNTSEGKGTVEDFIKNYKEYIL